jgi:hypothetical protein
MNRTAIKEAAALRPPVDAPRAAAQAAAAADAYPSKRKRNKRRTTMNKTVLSILCITVVGSAGCANRTPVLDERFGDAVRAARATQTINPDASRNADPVVGLDGLAAHESIERYKDATKAPPPVTNVINIGGSIGGGR